MIDPDTIDLDPKETLDTATLAAITKPMRLHSIFLAVATTLPVEKHEVRDSLQRLRKRGVIRCDKTNGEWHLIR